MSTAFDVEVVYALPHEQHVVRLRMSAGATVREAIARSALMTKFPEIDLGVNKVGVWGKPIGLDERVHARDRVEIYRPLSFDPKHARRLRAQRG